MTNWQTKKLGDIGIFSKGSGIPKDSAQSGELPAVRYGELYTSFDTFVRKSRSKIDKETANSATKITKGDILFAGSGETVDEIGKSAVYLLSEDGYAGGDIVIMSPSTEYSAPYLGYHLNSEAARKELRKLGQGQSVVHIYRKDLENLTLRLPEKPEQERIVGVLEVWDEYIEKLEQKIALKEQLKKGLMQQLLTGKRRLPGFKSHLATREFKDVFKVMSKYPGYKSSDYSSQGQYPIYDQSYDRYVSGYTDEHDKVITPDQPLTLFGDHSRVVKYIDAESFAVGNDGIKLFKAQNDIDDYYAYLLLKSYRVPNTGYNRHFKYIADAVFDIPEPAEQRQISSVIKVSDDEIKVLYNKLSEVKLQKKYLLKNLITGAIRTPEDLKPLDTTRLERSAL